MPTENEVRVMNILTSIEISPAVAAAQIVEWGNEAVTVVCEAALGAYPGLRLKVRTNATALLGWIDHPQAAETIPLLVQDPNADVAIRAIRAAAMRKSEETVPRLTQLLSSQTSTPILAAEALKALLAIDTAAARAAVSSYEAVSPQQYEHRASRVVNEVIATRRTQ